MKNDLINIRAVFDPLIGQGCRIFSVAGSGGKTSLIRRAALDYGRQMRVGVAASTKMYLPDDSWRIGDEMPQLITAGQSFAVDQRKASVCFYAQEILPNGKMAGIGENLLQEAIQNSDLLFIEADGSAGKPLKGWRSDEPVIVPATDVTVGILPVHCLGQKIEADQVHRMEAFSDITGLTAGDVMTVEAYRCLVMHPKGLFGHAVGKRLLVLNRAGNDRTGRGAEALAKACRFYVDQTVTGCLLDE